MKLKAPSNIDDLQGGDIVAPGKYHVFIQDAQEKTRHDGQESLIVQFQVLAGTTPGQEDKVHTEFFSMTDKAMARIIRLAMTLKLIGENEEKDVNWNDAVDNECIIEIEQQTYNGKTRNKISYMGIWPVGHEKVQDVPKGKKADTKEDVEDVLAGF